MTFCMSTFEKDDECLNILSTQCQWYPDSHFYLLVKTGDFGKNPPPLTTKNVAHYIILYTYSYKYLESDLIKHCHVIFIHSLGQPLIVRSHIKVQRSRGNPKNIPTWTSRVSNYSYFPWFNIQQTWCSATGSSL
jgi:hypothetical protein